MHYDKYDSIVWILSFLLPLVYFFVINPKSKMEKAIQWCLVGMCCFIVAFELTRLLTWN